MKSALSRPGTGHGQRPQSSLSQRPGSRLSSHRPLSRISNRPMSAASRQAAKVAQLTQTLVTQLLTSSPDGAPDRYSYALDASLRRLDGGGGPSQTIEDTDRRVKGLARKARINVQDRWAEALEQTYATLKNHVSSRTDFDLELKLSTLPDHMQFLLELSSPPVSSTLSHAEIILTTERSTLEEPPELTWKRIMDEEPFEGEHWEEIGTSNRSRRSTPPYGSESDSDDIRSGRSENSTLSTPSRESSSHHHDTATPPTPPINSALQNRMTVEDLQGKQYWRADWRGDVNLDAPFRLADPASFGPTLTRPSLVSITSVRFINEVDVIRDVLLSLQGISTPIIQLIGDSDGRATRAIVPSVIPLVAHLSPLSYRSLLSSLAHAATQLQQTRYLVQSTYDLRLKPVNQSNTSAITHYRTLEALAESLDEFVHGVEGWCAEREEEIFYAQRGHGKHLVVSLLGFESSLRQRMAGVLEVVDAVLRKIAHKAASIPPIPNDEPPPIDANSFTSYHPSILSTLILDGLFAAIREQLSVGETATSQGLLGIFTRTTQPIWSSIGRWLRDGMDAVEDEEIVGTLKHDQELFIEKGEVPLGSPDFWDEGYRLRKVAEDVDHSTVAQQRDAVPALFKSIAQDVLAAGKAVGLLRAMGLETPASFRMQEHKWLPFKQVYARSEENASKEVEFAIPALAGESQILDATAGMRWASDALVATVQDYAMSLCQVAHSQLIQVLKEDCELSRHLSGMQALFLMRRGDILSEWCDAVFAKVDGQERWSDFHFLNSAFQDIVAAHEDVQIDAKLVKISYQPGREHNAALTVRAFDGLSLEYGVPYPLTYLFVRPSNQIYSSVFLLLLQIRRAKGAIERILVRNALVGGDIESEAAMKPFYALRGRLSWFINTLLDFLVTHVIHRQVVRVQEALMKASSLDEMIQAHESYLGNLRTRCFLHPKMAPLHRAIMAILDLALRFTRCLTQFVGADVTYDVSRLSILGTSAGKRRKSRRSRASRKNVIGFLESMRFDETESSSSEDDLPAVEIDEGERTPHGRPSLVHQTTSYLSFTVPIHEEDEEGDFTMQLDKLSTDLDSMVKFIRKSIESLSVGTSETAATFGVLSFMLGDWDL